MHIKTRLAIGFGVITAGLIVIAAAASGGRFDVLVPKGDIANQQRDLIIISTVLMALVIVPVFVLTAHIAWKYRASNPKAHMSANKKPSKIKYTPDWDSNPKLEALWWGFPTIIIAILSVIIWQSSHALDPYRPIAAGNAPLKVQVVAMQWKWLFIYPQYDIASVNHLTIPVDRPVEFEITADAPMNSFWIPQLGGQVYAMSGMTTKLHLIADEPGVYRGSSANLSGEGFADMKFNTTALDDSEFNRWTQNAKQSPGQLSYAMYEQLAAPSRNNALTTYASVENNLHTMIIDKYGNHHGKDHD